jgi:hypothetical protein
MIVEKKTTLYSFKLDLDLFYEVWKLRKEHLTSVKLEDHPLVGKKIFDYHKNEELNIESVHKHWYGGWYIVLLVEHNKSHGQVLFQNISCLHPVIIEDIEESSYRYHLI